MKEFINILAEVVLIATFQQGTYRNSRPAIEGDTQRGYPVRRHHEGRDIGL